MTNRLNVCTYSSTCVAIIVFEIVITINIIITIIITTIITYSNQHIIVAFPLEYADKHMGNDDTWLLL
jgi:hypothetical protein